MFGRYFSSHKGGIFASPSVPQRENWNRPVRVPALRHPFRELLRDSESM